MALLTIRTVKAEGYRSLRRVHLPLDDLTVFVGANGVGKTNLYRALQLLQAAAAGTLSRELAAEGGMAAAIWAGRRTKGQPVRLKLGFEGEGPGGGYVYDIEVGFVQLGSGAAFETEPQVKQERLSHKIGGRTNFIMDRRGPLLRLVGDDGRLADHAFGLMASETALSALDEPARHPELHLCRRSLLACRFVHEVRADRDSPLRRPALAVTSPVLASDGSDLAAAFATLAHIRKDTADLDLAIGEAFPGAVLDLPPPDSHARFGIVFSEHPGRVFDAAELSDGTLRYIALIGALLSYRPAPFIALNEPETSLHPDLLDPLARLIVRAAKRSRIWVVTHSDRLASALAQHGGVRPRRVVKVDGETRIVGQRLAGGFDDEDEAD